MEPCDKISELDGDQNPNANTARQPSWLHRLVNGLEFELMPLWIGTDRLEYADGTRQRLWWLRIGEVKIGGWTGALLLVHYAEHHGFDGGLTLDAFWLSSLLRRFRR